MGRYPEVEAILNDYSGLDVQSIGSQMFERATESRLSQASQGSYGAYLRRLKAEEDERAALLDLLLVPETWFFRDPGTLTFLTGFVKTEWCAKADRGALRILSAPCSTGEEPYSIAMTLLVAGLKPPQFRIHAADISRKALSAAKAAQYAQTSFRRPLTPAQSSFFELRDDRSAVCESVRSLVTFSQGNLVDPDFMAGTEKALDVIFCKNLMIYLSQTGRARVMVNLARLLKDSGLLFVGHSEVALFQKAGYKPLSPARAFGLTKAKQHPEGMRVQPRRRLARTKVADSGEHVKTEARSHPKVELPKQVESRDETANAGSAEVVLQRARSLADRGDLQEAANLCRSLIGGNSMDVGAYYLAGLIEQSLDRLASAEDLFLKAIYLDPDHYETLVQLCLLAQKQGDTAKAGQYRRRLRRLDAGAKRG